MKIYFNLKKSHDYGRYIINCSDAWKESDYTAEKESVVYLELEWCEKDLVKFFDESRELFLDNGGEVNENIHYFIARLIYQKILKNLKFIHNEDGNRPAIQYCDFGLNNILIPKIEENNNG